MHSRTSALFSVLFSSAILSAAAALPQAHASEQEMSKTYDVTAFSGDAADASKDRVVLVAEERPANTGSPIMKAASAGGYTQAQQNTLNTRLRQAYLDHATVFSISEDKLPEQGFADALNKARASVLEADPSIFWVSNATSWQFKFWYRSTGVTKVEIPAYEYTRAQRDQMTKNYNAKLAEGVAWMSKAGTVAEKAKAAHDYLIRNCCYYRNATSPTATSSKFLPWTAYGALVEHKPVCQGYTYAYKALLMKAGISSKTLTGVANDGTSHIWNLVNVGGKYYNVDVTYDDPLKRGTSQDFGFSATPVTTMFLKSDAYLKAHTAQGSYHWNALKDTSRCPDAKYDNTAWREYFAGGAKVISITSGKTTGITNRTYNTKPQTQNLILTVNGKKLVKGTDYNVSYKNNTAAGRATITITGKGAYSGTITRTFNIAKVNLSKLSIPAIKKRKYNGKPWKPSPTVKVNGYSLKRNSDYTVSYSNNVRVGTAKVTIKAKGHNCTGSTVKTFKIVK